MLQLPPLELSPRRSEVAELVNRCPCRRKRELAERFREHLLQVILCGDTHSDMRIEMLTFRFSP